MLHATGQTLPDAILEETRFSTLENLNLNLNLDLSNNLAPVLDKRLQHTQHRPQSVFRLLEHHAPRRVEHIIRHLLGLSWQAVHEPPVVLGAAPLRQLVGHLKPGELFDPLGLLRLLAHRHPRIRHDDVRVFDRLLGHRRLGESEAGPCRRRRGDDVLHELGDRVARGCRHGDLDPQLGRPNGKVVKHIVRVAHPRDLQPFHPKTRRRARGRFAPDNFVDGQEVCDRLKRMVQVGERVDDRYRAMLGEVGDVRVAVDAGDDAGHHAADHHRGIVQRLVDAELDVAGAEKHGVAVHERYGGFGRDSCAGGAFAEGHGDCLAEKAVLDCARRAAGLDRSLMRGSISDQRGEFLWREISNREEMAWCER
nr:hypothetical protein CFP56_16514 [Quercus suber]